MDGAEDTRALDVSRPRLPVVGQPRRTPERADAARNRVAILEALRRLLKKQPIEDICMDAVAEAAGVGKGTIYRRFADRGALCRALLDEEAQRLQAAVLSNFELPRSAPFLDRIGRFFLAVFSFMDEHASLLGEAIAYERGPFGRYDRPSHRWLRDTLALYIARAIDRGEIPPCSPVTTSDFILAAIDPDLLRFHLSAGCPREALWDDFQLFWMRALDVPRPARPRIELSPSRSAP